MGKKTKQKGFVSIEEFKAQTNQPQLSDEEAKELIESLSTFAKITYRAVTMK